MVSLGKEGEEFMEMGSVERSKPLHIFTMPCLKWGSRKVMRCMKVNNSNGRVSASAFDHRRSSERSLIGRLRDSELERHGSTDRKRENFKILPTLAGEVGGSGRKSEQFGHGIEAVREKLMFDLHTAADKMKFAILGEDLEEREPPPATITPTVTDALKPWNLRTRRATFKASPANGISGGNDGGRGRRSFQVDVLKPNFSPLRTETTKSPRLLRGSTVTATDAAVALSSGAKWERAKFSISLSRQEIENDFMVMTGHKLPRRPRKRPKIVQKQMDTLFPGLWMTEINADFYKVPDAPEPGKR